MLTLEDVRERLRISSFNGWLGLEPLAVEPELVLRLPANRVFEGRPGSNILHGGVIAALIDVSCAMAVILRTGGIAASIDLSVDFLQAATIGPLTATVEVLRNGRTLATTLARVSDDQGRAIAIGRSAIKHMENWTGPPK